MPQLKNLRAEAYCLGVVEGKTGYDAAINAGYKESYALAPQLIEKGAGVLDRIAELRRKLEMQSLRTSAQRLKMLDDIADEAMANGDHKNVIRAIEAANKMVPDALAAHRTINENMNKNLEMSVDEAGSFLDVMIGD